MLSLERKAIVFLCILFIIFSLYGCGSDHGDGGYTGWISVDNPDSSPIVVENIDRIQITGRVFQSPVGGVENDEFVFALNVTVTNLTTGFAITASLSQPDIWSAIVPLAFGENLIEAYVEDANGVSASVQILVERVDTIPPEILSRSPEVNAVNVATTTEITIEFSEPLDPSSITISNISLNKNGSAIEGSVTFDEDTNVMLFTPSNTLLHNTSYSVAINSDVTDINGVSMIAESWQFITIPEASLPAVQTEDVTDIDETAAMIWGTVTPNYADTEAWFQWGIDSNLSIFTNTDLTVITALSGNIFLSSRINLDPGMNYFYRIVASNSAGTSIGDTLSFFTPGPPTVITSPPLLLSPYQVKLFGAVNPNGYAAESSFKISFDPVLGKVKSSSPPIQLGDGHDFINIDYNVSQMASGSKYYYRLDASYPGGIVSGDIISFTTPYSTSTCWAKRYHTYKGGSDILLREVDITAIINTIDDGYLFLDGSDRVVKTNSDGGVEWAHGYCISNTISCLQPTAIRQLDTGEYVIAGYHRTAYSGGKHHHNAWLALLDENGRATWAKEYVVNPVDYTQFNPSDIFQLSDGYVVLDNNNIMKVSITGDLIWKRNYTGGTDIAKLTDGYVVAEAHRYVVFHPSGDTDLAYDIRIRKIDADGVIQWQNDYSNTNKNIIKAIDVSSDTIAVAGTVVYPDDTSDISVFGIDTTGDITWHYSFDGGYNESASTIKAASDGGFIVGGNTDINGSDKGFLLLKLSNSGVLEWQTFFPDKYVAYPDISSFYDYRYNTDTQDTLKAAIGGGYIVSFSSIPDQKNSNEILKTDDSGSCSTLGGAYTIVPIVSGLVVSPSTTNISDNDSPIGSYDRNIDAVDWHYEIEQIYP